MSSGDIINFMQTHGKENPSTYTLVNDEIYWLDLLEYLGKKINKKIKYKYCTNNKKNFLNLFNNLINKNKDFIRGNIKFSTEFEEMIKEGKELAALHPNIVVKVPMIKDGVKAIKWFSDNGIKTNCTLVFSSGQALLAAKAGATYVSPFIGRLDDISHSGISLIEEIRLIYDNYGFETEILAASVRHTSHLLDCAQIGADVMTGPLKVISGLLKHPLTDIGLAQFLADHAKVNS